MGWPDSNGTRGVNRRFRKASADVRIAVMKAFHVALIAASAAAVSLVFAQNVGGTSKLGNKPALKGEEVAVLETTAGKIVVRFFNDKAPGHVKNFKSLVKKGFYNGTYFHRVIPGFMIQGGDPNTKDKDKNNDGMGGPGYTIKAEFNDVKHVAGILSMARSADPNSGGSQFFIMDGVSPHLDGQYTAFGQVIKGMDVVKKIVSAKTVQDGMENSRPVTPVVIKKATLVKGPVK